LNSYVKVDVDKFNFNFNSNVNVNVNGNGNGGNGNINSNTNTNGNINTNGNSNSIHMNSTKISTSLSLNFLKEYHVIIISEFIQKEIAEGINLFCRENKIGFIYTCIAGLAGYIFVDFGEMFIIQDEDGEENRHFYVRNITKGKPGIVTIDDSVGNKKLNFSYGDYVTFKEIVGMTELNDTPPRPIRVLSSKSFSIEDTSKFSQYISGGIIEQVKIPKPIFHRSLKENFENIEQEDIGSNL
jgi:ubiquitin-activating enzyme E1